MKIKSIRDLYFYQKTASEIHRYSVINNPENEAIRCYRNTFGRNPNLKNPTDLIEKIYWLQFNTDTSLWTKCADKYLMREYVSECGFGDYLPRNYGNWYDVNSMDFDSLPNDFVLKSNNGCGTVMIIRDKSTVDIKKVKHKLKHWLKTSYGWSGAQLHYTRIKPCIIAEELLKQDEWQKSFSPNSQVDYKVWCLNGKPENVLIVFDRGNNGYSLDLYDVQWNRLNEKLKPNGHFGVRENGIPKPSCLEEMMKIAIGLAKPFPEVRIDFYVVNDRPVIGELTFTTGYGYFTDDYYEYLGSKIILPSIQ